MARKFKAGQQVSYRGRMLPALRGVELTVLHENFADDIGVGNGAAVECCIVSTPWDREYRVAARHLRRAA